MDNWTGYAEHRTSTEIDKLLQFGHVIPISRGLTGQYVAEHFPGWEWNQILIVWKAAGIVLLGLNGGPPSCDERVVAVHFNGPDSFAVEWADGTVTTRQDH